MTAHDWLTTSAFICSGGAVCLSAYGLVINCRILRVQAEIRALRQARLDRELGRSA